MPLITRPQVYRVVRELLLWLESIQRRNERDRRSHEKRRAAGRTATSTPP